MRSKIIFFFLCGLLIVSGSGCAPLIVGAAVGAVGGYAASKDTIQGESDKAYESLWSAALDVSQSRAAIKVQDAASGALELEEGKNRIWIKLVRLTRTTTRIKVSCRRYHLPNLTLAQEYFTRILEQAD